MGRPFLTLTKVTLLWYSINMDELIKELDSDLEFDRYGIDGERLRS